ncbi:MAG: urease accessory protein UreF [Gammaproteobacteria bacterium]|nr:urease accessory protein UreF [Gammaproteobacteria bacterium]
MKPAPSSSLRLWQLISPALPVGAFAYSQGLEYAVEHGWVNNEETTAQWITGLMNHSLSALDVPILARLYKAWQARDMERVIYWNHTLQASRESNELLTEDRQIGCALKKLLIDLKIRLASQWPETEQPSFATMFALAASHWMITVNETCQGFLWAWSENQVAAAIKLVPLGQTAGQRILSRIIDEIPDAVARGLQLTDDAIGATVQGLGIASALHETQYTRLFRS